MSAYKDFQKRFQLLASKNPKLINTTLSNIFTMRLIGNKTHGDLAEIAIDEFINQFMYDFKSVHVGKTLFRAKKREEDIRITNEITKEEFNVSLKAYGDGPLQLSTDSRMFPYLENIGKAITDKKKIQEIFKSTEFTPFSGINVMPLIYDEKKNKCNIMVFDADKAVKETAKIVFIGENQKYSNGAVVEKSRRELPIYLFLDKNDNYICEIRYGDAKANALQRGIWTNTKKASNYFDSLTNGWIDYVQNQTLFKLLYLTLVASEDGHKNANIVLQRDIDEIKNQLNAN